MILEAQFPEKLRFLAQPHPYKVLFGGRGGAKSWGIARQLLIDAANRPLRTLCARETMNSIADSVHKLLSDQIASLKLGAYFEIQKSAIIGRNGSEFAFVGLRHNATQIKSYEGFDRAWVEEAQSVSKSSWEILIPTIRKEASEIWISFNPVLDTDDTYQRFVVRPDPRAMVVKTSWRDNPWVSAKFLADMRHMQATTPEEYEHVYEGLCRQSVEGAIYAKELAETEKAGRLTRVAYDPTRPVHTFWDLGFGDNTAIWFVQALPWEFRLIDFESDSGQALAYYQKRLQARPYVYGTHYLPHDAKARTLATGKSVEELLRAMGFSVQIVPQLSVIDGINATRTIFPQCWFDSEKCADGIQALRHYRWAPDGSQGQQKRQPLHDWASHAGDAFRYFAVGVKAPKQPAPAPKEPVNHDYSPHGWMA